MANRLVANDDTLMAVYPKIRGVPDEQRKRKVQEAGRANNRVNMTTILTRETLKKFTADKERGDYNRELARLTELEEDKARQKKLASRRKELETARQAAEQVAQKQMKAKVQQDTEALVHKIEHGEHRNDIERSSIRGGSNRASADDRVMTKILKQNRKKADKRAEPRTERDEHKYTMNDVRKLACDKDAKPLDSAMWGNAVFMKTPATSYGMTYQDPVKVLEQQRALAELFKEVASQEPTSGRHPVDTAVMKGYLDDKDRASDFESEGSLEEQGDQGAPDLGEVILETDGEQLRESQQLLDDTLEEDEEGLNSQNISLNDLLEDGLSKNTDGLTKT